MQGDPTHPVTQGFLCGKVAKYLDRVYAPDRILYPLRRKPGVPKGPLATRPASTKPSSASPGTKPSTQSPHVSSRSPTPTAPNRSCPTATRAPSACSASAPWIAASSIVSAPASSTAPSALKPAAWRGTYVYGKKLGTPTEDFRLAKLILAWGANIHGNNIHLWPFVEQARRNGARLIVIDPYKTRTAALADWHIAIRPGTDVALALGMMHVILREGLEDRAYIDAMTHGFDQLAERVRDYTPERVAAWTGMTPAEVEQLAREYATTRPAALRMNYGVQRIRKRRHRGARHLPCCPHSPARGNIAAAARSSPLPADSPGTRKPSSVPTSRSPRPSSAWPAPSTCAPSATRSPNSGNRS